MTKTSLGKYEWKHIVSFRSQITIGKTGAILAIRGNDTLATNYFGSSALIPLLHGDSITEASSAHCYMVVFLSEIPPAISAT